VFESYTLKQWSPTFW